MCIRLFGVCVEVFIIYNYLDTILGKIKFGLVKTILSYLATCTLLFLLGLLFYGTIINFFAVFIVMMLLTFFYNKSITVNIISSAIFIILIALSEVLTGMILAFITSKNVDFLTDTPFFYIQGVFISNLFLLIMVKFLKYFSFSSSYPISRFLFIPLLALPASTILIIYTLSDYAYTITETRPVFLIFFSIAFLIVSNILLFYLFEENIKSEDEKRKTQLVQQQLQNQAQYFKDLSEKHKLSNKAIHDTKNQLFAISILLSNNETNAAKLKIDELCKNVFNTINISKTGNDAIDALINNKYQMIQQNNIIFNSNFVINSINEVDDIELCIIMGNALDNAIEACNKIKHDQNKEINLKAVQIGDYLSIEISNTIDEPVNMLDNRPVTNKAEKELHGFGLQSIEEIVNKYDGHINFLQEDRLFYLKIFMKNQIIVPILKK